MSVDLTTTYLGLKLKNPLVAAASPLTGNMETLLRLADAGVAAIVCPSLFEEQIVHEEMEMGRLYDYGADSFAESSTFFPEPHEYRIGCGSYMEHIAEAKRRLSVPVIGMLHLVLLASSLVSKISKNRKSKNQKKRNNSIY